MNILKYFFLPTCIFALLACQEIKDVIGSEEPEVEEPEYSNEEIPQDNGLLTYEEAFGDESAFSEFYFSKRSTLGGFYAIGVLNFSQVSANITVGQEEFLDYYDPVLIRFDRQGQMLWLKRPGFSIESFEVIPSNLVSGNHELIVLIGDDENDLNNPADSDRNRILIYDETGRVISNYLGEFRLSANSLALVNNTPAHFEFLSAGGAYSPSRQALAPGFYLFKVNKDDLEVDAANVDYSYLFDTDWYGVSFQNLAVYKGRYVVSGMELAAGPGSSNVGLRIAVFDPSDLKSPRWEKRVYNERLPGGIFTHAKRSLHVADDKIFVCGYYEDPGKSESAGGKHRVSAYVYCFRYADGRLLWKSPIPGSAKSDRLNHIQMYNGRLYAAGGSSNAYCTYCSDSFYVGNAWICKLDPQNGNLIQSRTFGHEEYKTWISQFEIIDDQLLGVGSLRTTLEKSRAWIVRMDIDDL